jgi:hypothetical protein
MKEPNFFFKCLVVVLIAISFPIGAIIGVLFWGFMMGFDWVTRTISAEPLEKKE